MNTVTYRYSCAAWRTRLQLSLVPCHLRRRRGRDDQLELLPGLRALVLGDLRGALRHRGLEGTRSGPFFRIALLFYVIEKGTAMN